MSTSILSFFERNLFSGELFYLQNGARFGSANKLHDRQFGPNLRRTVMIFTTTNNVSISCLYSSCSVAYILWFTVGRCQILTLVSSETYLKFASTLYKQLFALFGLKHFLLFAERKFLGCICFIWTFTAPFFLNLLLGL